MKDAKGHGSDPRGGGYGLNHSEMRKASYARNVIETIRAAFTVVPAHQISSHVATNGAALPSPARLFNDAGEPINPGPPHTFKGTDGRVHTYGISSMLDVAAGRYRKQGK